MASGYIRTFDSNIVRLGSTTGECKFTLLNFSKNNRALKISILSSTVNSVTTIVGVEVENKGNIYGIKKVAQTNRLIFELNAVVKKLPYVLEEADIYINEITDNWDVFRTSYMQILMSPMGSVVIEADVQTMSGNVTGLCGNFDHHQENDFIMESGGMASENEFLQINSEGQCGKANIDVEDNPKCVKVKDVLMANCPHLDQSKQQQLVEGCKQSQTDSQLCAVLMELQLECNLSLDSPPILSIMDCKPTCREGFEFKSCRRDCERSCSDLYLKNSTTCDTTTCFQGCGCPVDQFMLEEDGVVTCVGRSECPCWLGTKLIKSGHSLIVDCQNW
ncbi:mucin-5B-like [Gigantopelta aegis]|uniref:mucin-5B-like n=1 Tax=Gigantopelta aegis TaxID=1735272 RepID=UPI001B88E16F|nr:mucin-5B-like [Gigantopelta aegis]